MSWWKKPLGLIFGGSKTTDDIFDKDSGLLTKAGKWIDEFHHTTQEQSEDFKEVSAAWSQFVKDTLAENTERSKARRDIAIFWIRFQLLMIFWAALVFPFLPLWSAFILKISFSTLMVTGTIGVLGFFFGPYMYGAHIKKKSPESS